MFKVGDLLEYTNKDAPKWIGTVMKCTRADTVMVFGTLWLGSEGSAEGGFKIGDTVNFLEKNLRLYGAADTVQQIGQNDVFNPEAHRAFMKSLGG